MPTQGKNTVIPDGYYCNWDIIWRDKHDYNLAFQSGRIAFDIGYTNTFTERAQKNMDDYFFLESNYRLG